MSYRKFKADYLFDGERMLEKDEVLICREDGTIEGVQTEEQAGEGVETLSGMLSPGFINCHCHLELSHLKGLIPQKTGLVDFVFAIVRTRGASEEVKQEAIARAEADMMAAGIVAVGDICNTSDTVLCKSAKRLAYYNIIESSGWTPAVADARYEIGRQLVELFKELLGDVKHLCLSPHAPYSVSDPLWDLLEKGFAGKTISIHNQESAAENELFLSGGGDLNRMYENMKMDISHFNPPGTSSLPSFLPHLKTAENILLIHNTCMSGADRKIASAFSKSLFFCFCPNANQYIENQLPDIPSFKDQDANLVLGTDSLASNGQLSILDEMKTIKKVFPATKTVQLLRWATSNGARALQLTDHLGNFSKSKKPGILLMENLYHGEIGDRTSVQRIL